MNDVTTQQTGESLWGRLRRRKLVQWGIAYVAAAWALLQGLGFLVLLLGGGAFWYYQRTSETPTAASTSTSAAPPSSNAAATATDRSIAVLPFVNMSTDKEQEYFADGISEELLNLLAQVPELRVIAQQNPRDPLGHS